MTNDSRDTLITEQLSRLRAEIEVPPIDCAREQALLAAFDAYWARPRQGSRRWAWTAAAATVALAVTAGWPVLRHGSFVPVTTEPPDQIGQFVPWPGAQLLPPLESGELIRVPLPVSALPALGLTAPAAATSVVQADVVVGQDGLARAVRLVQQ